MLNTEIKKKTKTYLPLLGSIYTRLFVETFELIIKK